MRVLEMTTKKPISKNPYARIKEWKLFRKRVVESKKKYDRKKFNLDKAEGKE
jgi:hypothetical protein